MEMDKAEIKKLAEFCQKMGLKFTSARRKVLETIMACPSHFQAEDLLVQMRQQGVKVSKASIYRTLPLLVQGSFIREVGVGDKQTHYQYSYGRPALDHLICLNCGKISEFRESKVNLALQEIYQKYGFTPKKEVILEIEGYCEFCRHAIPES